jgi:hypothetical protein
MALMLLCMLPLAKCQHEQVLMLPTEVFEHDRPCLAYSECIYD